MPKGDRPKVLDRLPDMKMSQIMRLWLNAVDMSKGAKAGTAWQRKKFKVKSGDPQLVINAIRKEWIRRGKNPLADDEFFAWPSTEATGGDGALNTAGWVTEGVLGYMGYRVGTTDGRSTPTRQKILYEVFSGPLPPVFPPDYADEWGEPETARRLQKMAEAIAAFTRNAKRRDRTRMLSAIRDWENDLRHLYLEYYIERFRFAWPDTET